MAGTSSDWAENEEVVRWQKLVELGPERGLCEAGLSQDSIDKVIRLMKSSAIFWDDAPHQLSDIEDGMAMLMAFVGRGNMLSLERGRGYEMNSNEATALCVNMASNTRIAELHIMGHSIFGIDQKITTLFANALKTNSTLIKLTLTKLDMGSEAVRSLLDGLRANKKISILELSANPLLDEGVNVVVEFLSNTSLKRLLLSGTGYGSKGAKLLSSALGHNTTLEELVVGKDNIGRRGMKKLLEPLSRDTTISSDGPKNTTLRCLGLYNMSRESFCVDSVALMIRVNRILTSLDIRHAPLDAEDWTGKIFPALQENKTLKELFISGCRGLDSEEVRSAFISLIKEGKIGLEKIYISDQTWNAQVREELRINKAYRDKLRDQPMVTPTSRRIILCGREYAGKTTIRNTVERTVYGTPWYHAFYMAYKGVMRTCPQLTQMFFGIDAHKELSERTRGFDVLVFKEKPRTSLWDFAGQKEYYVLHDYMFPNANNSCFLYVCSCLCPPTHSNLYVTEKEMKDDCSYWLRFIASNSKRRVKDSEGVELPHVQFVLTKTDTLEFAQKFHFKRFAKNVVTELRKQFKSVVELAENVEVVNAHNDAEVKRLILELTCPELEKIVEKQRVYEICNDVQNALDAWSGTESSKPVVSLEEFRNICMEQKKLTLDEEVEQAVLRYLNDMGDVIYPAGLHFIVVKPRWFGNRILGYLVDAYAGAGQRWCWPSDCIVGHSKEPLCPPSDGIMRREDIEELVACSLETMNLRENIDLIAGRLVQLMVQLEMCFEEDPRNKNSRLFFPALFDEKVDNAGGGERKLKWTPECGKHEYFGRRLQCEDESTTFLTPGFFPRLQVHLLLYMREKNWTNNQEFKMDRNLIRFTENGHDICIEYKGGNYSTYIDIMVRSSRPYKDALIFVEEHVIKKIYQFCALPQGCQGVELVEAVVRLACVQRLMVCTEREAHSVLVSELRNKVNLEGREYLHTWRQEILHVKHRDVALHLLEGEPNQECSSSGSSAPRIQNLPNFYLEPDPGFWANLTERISVAGLKPFKLHLYCNYEDGSENKHEVLDQPGRTITLPWNSRYDFSFLASAVKFVWSKFGPGVNIDTLIDAVFERGDINDVDRKGLEGLQKTSDTSMETMEILRDYIACVGGLKQILKDDDKNIGKDFLLQRMKYDSGRIGWYCKEHFHTAFKKKEWKD